MNPIRRLAHRRGYALTSVATRPGIGANLAIFSVLNALVSGPCPTRP
jgi:hypothetical protein